MKNVEKSGNGNTRIEPNILITNSMFFLLSQINKNHCSNKIYNNQIKLWKKKLSLQFLISPNWNPIIYLFLKKQHRWLWLNFSGCKTVIKERDSLLNLNLQSYLAKLLASASPWGTEMSIVKATTEKGKDSIN